MNNSPQEKLNITTEGGARTISIYTERKIKIYAVSEPELESISYFNTASMVCFSLGSFILSTFIDDLRHPKPDDFHWIFNPIGWVTAVLFILGILALVKKTSALKKIKEQSLEISK